MAVGPIEIVTIGFENGTFDGSIVGELAALVNAGTITVVDGVFVRKTGEHDYDIAELSQAEGLSELVGIVARVEGLLNDEDVDTVAEELPVGSAAAILCFEHTWFIPLRSAIVAAGGTFLDTVRIPAFVVEEVLAAIAAEGKE